MSDYSTFDAFKHARIAEGMYTLEDSELAALQHALTSMLRDIIDVFERHNINWTLAYGSCLGAVRHHGFIPWDDDLDISLFREGYNRLVEVFDDELGTQYLLQDPERTEGYDLCFPRIRKRGTLLKCRDDYFSDDAECGIYIDLLVWEGVPKDYLLRQLHGFVSLALGFAYSCRRFAKYGNYYIQMAADERTERVFRKKRLIGKAMSFLSMDVWTRIWYRWNCIANKLDSEYVSIPSARKHYFGELAKRNDILPTKEVSYEGLLVRIPGKWEKYLTSIYGDNYMTPPPIECREKHVVIAFDLGFEGSYVEQPKEAGRESPVN